MQYTQGKHEDLKKVVTRIRERVKKDFFFFFGWVEEILAKKTKRTGYHIPTFKATHLVNQYITYHAPKINP